MMTDNLDRLRKEVQATTLRGLPGQQAQVEEMLHAVIVEAPTPEQRQSNRYLYTISQVRIKPRETLDLHHVKGNRISRGVRRATILGQPREMQVSDHGHGSPVMNAPRSGDRIVYNRMMYPQ